MLLFANACGTANAPVSPASPQAFVGSYAGTDSDGAAVRRLELNADGSFRFVISSLGEPRFELCWTGPWILDGQEGDAVLIKLVRLKEQWDQAAPEPVKILPLPVRVVGDTALIIAGPGFKLSRVP